MVFDIIAVVAFVLSSLCTVFLGTICFALWKRSQDMKRNLDRFRFDFSTFGGDELK